MIKSKLCLMAVVLAMVSPAAYAQVYFPGTGHIYEPVLVPGGITWDDASAAAQAAGGYLATLTSATEDQFVFDLINNPIFYSQPSVFGDSLGPWIGGLKHTGQSTFEWVTSEPFTYSNFESNQPDGAYGSEQRIQYYKINASAAGSKWGDHPGGPISGYSLPTAYVIERVTQLGDYNNNGTVDAADYVVWRNGDSPDDSPAGYDLWKANFGKTAGSGTALSAVPEPSTLLLVVAAVAALGVRCRRSHG